MKKLVNGIVEFRKTCLENYREKFAHLALGQFPDALFIACSDSRVVPNLFASTNPGDLFVIRNVGNLIPSFSDSRITQGSSEEAAIEFSLTNLPIKNIIVCGHSDCGAMRAILEGIEKLDSPGLKGWLKHCECVLDDAAIDDVKFKQLADHNKLSQINILQQMGHVKTYPKVIEKMNEGLLNVHGWYFDIATGDVYAYEEKFKQFTLIDEDEASAILSRLN
ncbi:MAG: carbonic anhydrase [Parachlamydiaceae bacterium]|nr:carbonic anhydrase [Parachlamydiaceae bacterium]